MGAMPASQWRLPRHSTQRTQSAEDRRGKKSKTEGGRRGLELSCFLAFLLFLCVPLRPSASSALNDFSLPVVERLFSTRSACLVAGEGGPQIVAVHSGDELDADLLRAGGLALVLVGAVAEALRVHLRHHPQHALLALRLALRQHGPGATPSPPRTASPRRSCTPPRRRRSRCTRPRPSPARHPTFGTGIALPSGAPPVFTETNPPAWMMRSNALRSTPGP